MSNRCEFLLSTKCLSDRRWNTKTVICIGHTLPSHPQTDHHPFLLSYIHGSRSAHQSILGHVRKTFASTCGPRVCAEKFRHVIKPKPKIATTRALCSSDFGHFISPVLGINVTACRLTNYGLMRKQDPKITY